MPVDRRGDTDKKHWQGKSKNLLAKILAEIQGV